MKKLYNEYSEQTTRLVTKKYSTSFSIGVRLLDKKLRQAVHNLYAFVRLADEIVDSFQEHNPQKLLSEFREATDQAIEQGFSTHPILHGFQKTVNDYQIEPYLYHRFLDSMQMDLEQQTFDHGEINEYILGSAEVVGLMCLRVFTENDREEYERLRPAAMKLGSAYQKVNFLRDVQNDYVKLGRCYFPNYNLSALSKQDKLEIENSIERDFREGYKGIRNLPKAARLGVYVSYVYYYSLFKKIQDQPFSTVLQERIRIPNHKKFTLLAKAYVKHSFNLL